MADHENHSGRVLGEFVLRERLAEGGFGTVYRAEQPVLAREAVVKVMHQRLHRKSVAMQRFMREAQIASRLDHPYAAHVYAFGVDEEDGEENGLPWIAMELVQGITLTRWLQTRGAFPLERLVPFFERVAAVVQAAHERGIVHRDLKPSNVMVIESAGELLPKLLDFGVARVLDETFLSLSRSSDGVPLPDPEAITQPIRRLDDAESVRNHSGRLTRSSAAVGSPPYMAPEQWISPTSVGPSADIYALGLLAYEAFSGRPTFLADSVDGYAGQHCHAKVPLLGEPGLDRVIGRALEKLPEDRWATALELAVAMRAELRTHPREQLASAARQWQDRGRPRGLLWPGDMLADFERRSVHPPTAIALAEPASSFVAASRRCARQAVRKRRLLAVLAISAALGVVEYRAALKSDTADAKARAADQLVTRVEAEQGQEALRHHELADAQQHLWAAYQRGDRSAPTTFMLARALQSLESPRARLAAVSGRMWTAAWSPDGRQIVTTDGAAAQIWDARTLERQVVLPHGDIVYDAKYSPDSEHLVTVCGDGRVRLWDVSTGKLVREFAHEGNRPRYSAVAISPDGRFVVAMDGVGARVDVWELEAGRPRASVRTDASAWSVLAFSPDGRWLAANNGNDVRVLDTTTWGVVTTIAGPHIRALSFDPTSARLVTGSTDGDAALWAIPSGELLRVLRRGDPVDSVSWSPDGAWIATASRDGEQQIWNATSGVLRNQGNYIHDKISSLEFDSTSKTLLAAGTNGSVVLSDAEIGIPIAELGAPRSSVSSAHFDPTSQQVVGAFWDGTARVWGGAPAFRHWTSPPVSDSCGFGAALVPDGRFVAVGCRNRPTRIYDTANSQLLAELPNVTHVDEGEFTTVFPAVTADGDRAAIIRGETVEVYAVRSHKLVQTIDHHAAVSTVAFAPTGHDLVSGDVLGGVLLTREGARPRALPSAAASIDALAILADDRVIVSDASKRLRVLDPGHDAVLASIEAPMRAMLLRPSSAGDRLLTVPAYTASEAAVLWDLRRYKLVAQLVGHVGQTRSARFERDDLEIVTAGGDGTARRWDGFTGAPLESYQDGSRFLMDATLSPDGSMVVAAGGDGLVRFWDTATKRLLWSFPAHSPHVIALHFEDNDLVTRGFGGDISRWMLPKPQTVIERCETGTGCVTVSR